jgi:hypothetical protein
MSSASWLFSRADGASRAVSSGHSRADEFQCHCLSDYLSVNRLAQKHRVVHDRTRLRDRTLGNIPQTAELIAQLATSLEAKKELHKIAPR